MIGISKNKGKNSTIINIYKISFYNKLTLSDININNISFVFSA